MNKRKQKAIAMMNAKGHFAQTAVDKFEIKSQSNPNKNYHVNRTGNGLVCECKDHTIRKADCKHIQFVKLMMIQNKGYANDHFKIIERTKLNLCRYCDSGNIKKDGIRVNKKGNVQRFKCLDCKKRFTNDFGFEKKRFDSKIITGALQMYYSGMSVRDISTHYEMFDTDVNHSTVYRWVVEYSTMLSKYIDEIMPRLGNWVRADEVWVKVSGEQKYLFASMDDDTRYWLASDMADTKFQHSADTLLELTKKASGGKNPKHFITDGLPAYQKASKRVFGKKTHHTRHIHLKGDRNNNKMERLNGEIRDREKVFRGLKKKDSGIIDGMKVYYNYAKKHSGIGNKRPSEEAKITVEGRNKWRTLIQNASLHDYETV